MLGGLSKSANLMGWRVGWVLAPTESAAALTAVHQAVCTCASSLSQLAAIPAVEALGGGEGAEEIAQNLDLFARRRRAVLDVLDAAGLRYAPARGAFYVWVHVAPHLQPGEDDLGLCMRLLAQQALIAIPGQGFGDAGQGWLRLAYTSAQAQEGAQRLARGLGL